MNKEREKQLRRQIVKFMDLLAVGSDNAFGLPEQNRIYLQGLALGWIMAQPWYDKYQEDLLAKHPRENVELTLSDGIIDDIIDEETSGNPAFDPRSFNRSRKVTKS